MLNLETGVFLLVILLLAMIHTLGEVFYKKGSMMFVQNNLSIKDISRLSTVGFPLFIIVFSTPNSAAADPLHVHVVNYPLQYFAERIGNEHVKVEDVIHLTRVYKRIIEKLLLRAD